MAEPLRYDEMTPKMLEQYAELRHRSYRLARLGLVVDGDPFDLTAYPHVVQILDDDHPHIVIIKGAQLGLTICHVLKALDRAIWQHLRGTMYLFPRDDDVSDFSKARFRRILQDNPALARHVGDTESIGIKEVGGSFVYFRAAGAREAATRGSKSKLKSVPIDDLYLDERDDMDDSRVELVRQRLVESPDPHLTELGTPTIPEYGVDSLFQQSDQHTWHHKCRKCRQWTCLELTWPDCLATESDRAWFVCAHCRDELVVTQSEWVAKHPEKDAVRGYWISRLNSKLVDPLKIALEWENALREGRYKLSEFYNSTLGLPYADEDDVLTEAACYGACKEHTRTAGSPGPCALGADVGPDRIHYQIRERLSEDGRRSRVIQWGHVNTVRELGDLMERYSVRCAVVDEMAETRTVREFCQSFIGRAFGCWYSPAQKGRYRWDIPQSQVHVNRTESLDASHREIVAAEVEFPRPDELFEKEVLPQLTNLARIVEQDDISGQRKAKWIVRRGAKNDHLRHAHNYARIALERIGLADRLQQVRRNQQAASRGTRKRGFMAR